MDSFGRNGYTRLFQIHPHGNTPAGVAGARYARVISQEIDTSPPMLIRHVAYKTRLAKVAYVCRFVIGWAGTKATALPCRGGRSITALAALHGQHARSSEELLPATSARC